MSSPDAVKRVRYSVSTGNIPSIITSPAAEDKQPPHFTQNIPEKPRSEDKNESSGTMSTSCDTKREREQVTVLIKCTIVSVEKIDTTQQQFTCTFVLCGTWKEPRLKGRTTEESVDWDTEWLPKIAFLNSVELDTKHREYRLFCGDQSQMPYAQETRTIRGTFTQAMQLQDFPFDFQELTIILSSEWSNSTVVFYKDMTKDDVILRENFPSPDWSVCPHVITSRGTDTSRARDYSLYSIQFHVKRKAQPYLWSTVLELLLFAVLVFSSFAIPVSATADRLIVTFILLLAVVSIRLRRAGSVTGIDHLTFLDKYTLASHLFISVVAIGHAVARVIGDPPEQNAFDRIWLYVTIVLFVFGQLAALCFVLSKMSYVDKAMQRFLQIHQATSDEIERQRKERDWYAEKRARERGSNPNGLDKPDSHQEQSYRTMSPSTKAYV